MSENDKRDELRTKIEARERRIAERSMAESAREVADAAGNFAKENPMVVLGGAIGIGLLIGLATAPGRRAASGAVTKVGGAVGDAASGAAKTVSTAAKKRGSALGALFADAIVAYGIKLIDDAMSAARSGQDKLEDLGDSATAKAREVRRESEYLAGSAIDKTRTVSRRTRRRAERAVREIKDRVTN